MVLLEDTNRVQVGMDASIDLKLKDQEQSLGGGVTLTSGLRYDNDGKAFYLEDPQFERFEVEGIPEKHLDRVTEACEKLAKALLEDIPVYRLEAKDAKMAGWKPR